MANNESILDTVKKALGVPSDYNVYDPDIIMHINTAMMVLNQTGVGPKKGFTIQDSSATWSDFIEESHLLAGVQTHVYAKVKILFDPPKSSFGLESLNKTVEELEWRLRSQMLEIDGI